MKQKELAEFINRVRLGVPLASDVKSLSKQQLAKHSEDSTHTVGLENVITVKVKVAVGCKVILQHNTNVTLGLVSETIRTIRGIQWCIDHTNKVDALTIMFCNRQEHC